MDVIVRKHLRQKLKKGARREYYEQSYNIYTEEEAIERKLSIVSWRDAKKGEWGLTDDGYVAECLNRRKYGKRNNVVFPFGQAFTGGHAKGRLEYMPHKLSGSYSMVSAKPAWMTKKGKSMYKRFVTLYVLMSLEGKIDYDKLGKSLGNDEAKPAVKAKSLLKKEWVQEMVSDEIKKHLKKKDIDEGSVIDMIKKAYSVAEDKNDPSNMLRASENFINILGMKASTRDIGPDHMELEGVSLEQIADALDPAKEISDASAFQEKTRAEDDDLVVAST